MVDSSQAHLADDAVRARVDEVLDRVGLDFDEVPKDVIERLAARTRHPESRLSVGRYVIVGELGRGGMGVVYEGWDPGIDRRVAIKTIEPDLVPEEERDEVIERFKREVKIVGRLHHPAIVTIHDSGLERERDPISNRRVTTLYYYVMEYLDGSSLARVLREKRRLTDEAAVAIAADIAEALQLSHDAGIIHRDIKPSNIFLRNEHEAVLLDFGIAKTGSVALTRQGQILGTPSYLAPERLREKEVAIDGRADIFSLGVLLFTMLTGEAPFVGDDVYEVIDKIAKASHPKLGRDTPSGQALSRVIDRMLAKDPSARYATAGEAAIALRHVQSLFGLVPESMDVMDSEFSDEPTGERVATSPSTPTPMAPARPASPAGEDADTGRLTLAKSAPPPLPPPAPRPERAPVMPSAPNTELLVNSVVDREEPPGVPTTVSGAPVEDDTFDPTDDVPSDSGIVAADTEVAPAHSSPVRVADVLGTRPELALQRETRELIKNDLQIADLIKEELEQPHIEDTSPSLRLPSAKITDEEEAYEDHSASNDEATDDETVADPSRRVPSGIRNAPLRAGADAQQTEQLVRAHTANPPRDGSQAPQRRGRSRSRPIEASLVDEDEVVVKPAPLESLKPDELPTQTGFKLPSSASNAEVLESGPLVGDVVRARGDSQVQDPAEVARKESGEVSRQNPAREISLVEAEGPALQLDVPRSAAVARKTFGTSRSKNKRKSPVQVRVSGNPLSQNAEDRMRLIRRRGIMLLTATLASVAIGLFLGRMKQPSTDPTEVDLVAPKKGPKVEPRVSAVKRIPGSEEVVLVRPRPPIELIRDAEAARASNQLQDAARLYKNAAQALGAGHELHGLALLGYADALNEKGDKEEAITIYRDVRRRYPKSVEAQKARQALTDLGVSLSRRRTVKDTPDPGGAPPPPPPAQALKPVAPTRVAVPITADMSPDQKCLAILRNHLDSPRRAVQALEALEAEHPRAPCVFWNLGRKYERLNDLRAALDAYRQFLKLDPRSQKRASVERQIADLEAKLRQ